LISSVVLRQLNDSQVQQLAEKALAHLNHSSSGDTGYLLFREAPNGRTPISYIDLVESQIVEDTSTTTAKWGYTLVFVKSNDFKTAHVSFLFQKARLEDFHGFKTLREFMDHKQYSRRGVLTYEKIFGDGFVSTGGLTTTSRFLEQYLKPTAGQRLLDVGCGIGGGDFYVADVLQFLFLV
jgi:phosphoethanolamine N-methyltransferase